VSLLNLRQDAGFLATTAGSLPFVMTYPDVFDEGVGFELAEDDTENDLPPSTPPRKRVSFAPMVLQQRERQATTDRLDPWEMLDPHTQDATSKPRPLRVGKTIVLPPGIQELPSACVTGARTRKIKRRPPPPKVQQHQSRSLATETFQATMTAARKRSLAETTNNNDADSVNNNDPSNRKPSLLPLKGLVFGDEFAYIAKATAKRKAAERREQRKQLQLQRKQESTTAGLVANTAQDYDDDDDDGGGYAFAGGDDYGGDDDDNDGYDIHGGPIPTNTGMVSVDEVYRDENNDSGTYFPQVPQFDQHDMYLWLQVFTKTLSNLSFSSSQMAFTMVVAHLKSYVVSPSRSSLVARKGTL
jgi:hypothetical protein